MSLQLRDNLHWCDCGGRAVFLDLKEDRYFCLSHRTNEAFLRLVADGIGADDAERLNVLIALGLLVEKEANGHIISPPSIEYPTRDFVSDRFPKARLIQVLQALASELRLACALRFKPFQKVIEAVRTPRPRRLTEPAGANRLIREIVAASAVAALVTRSHNRCLVRALTVYRMCSRRGLAPQLVLGVIAHPFAAHCWVQLGSAVLVGSYDQARLYTPIFVLE